MQIYDTFYLDNTFIVMTLFEWRLSASHSLSTLLTEAINYEVIGMLQICEMIQWEILEVITLNEFKALILGPLKQPLLLHR